MVAVAVPTGPAPASLEVVEPPEEILARFLPAILRQDPFLSRFLRVFDDTLRPLIEQIDAADAYLDPALAPDAMLAWLAAWVGEHVREDQPRPVQSGLVSQAALIHRMRGTKAGLRLALEIITGGDVYITENSGGLRLDEDARLGVNTALEPFDSGMIHITLQAATAGLDVDTVVEAVERLKPAHTVYTIHVSEA